MKSPADENRSAGVFASAFATASSTASGSVSRRMRRRVGFSVISLAIIACALPPETGGSPASISYSTDGERVHVAARVDGAVARGLLGTHVLRRAERESGLREAIASRLGDGERDAEVGQHRLAFLKQDVLRLDVAVHQSLSVRVVERARDLLGDRERLVEAELVLALQLLPQRFAANVRQHVVEHAVRVARVDERENVRMVEPRRDLDLGEEPLGAEDRAELGAQDLERDVTIELAVVGEVDDGHPARPELAFDRVPLAEDSGEGRRGWRLGHGFAPSSETKASVLGRAVTTRDGARYRPP